MVKAGVVVCVGVAVWVIVGVWVMVGVTVLVSVMVGSGGGVFGHPAVPSKRAAVIRTISLVSGVCDMALSCVQLVT